MHLMLFAIFFSRKLVTYDNFKCQPQLRFNQLHSRSPISSGWWCLARLACLCKNLSVIFVFRFSFISLLTLFFRLSSRSVISACLFLSKRAWRFEQRLQFSVVTTFTHRKLFAIMEIVYMFGVKECASACRLMWDLRDSAVSAATECFCLFTQSFTFSEIS